MTRCGASGRGVVTSERVRTDGGFGGVGSVVAGQDCAGLALGALFGASNLAVSVQHAQQLQP